jgi:hypothetical protein
MKFYVVFRALTAPDASLSIPPNGPVSYSCRVLTKQECFHAQLAFHLCGYGTSKTLWIDCRLAAVTPSCNISSKAAALALHLPADHHLIFICQLPQAMYGCRSCV